MIGSIKNFDKMNKRMKHFQGGPIDLSNGESDQLKAEEMVSWVLPPGLDVEEERTALGAGWDLRDLVVEGGLLLRMRIERRKVPSELVQQIVRSRLYQLRQDRAVGRQEQKEIREQVKRDLLKQCLPVISYLDGYWKEDRKELVLFSNGKKNCELFCNLFLESFGEKKSHLLPYQIPFIGFDAAAIEKKLNSSKELRSYEKLIPSQFIAGTSAAESPTVQ